LLRATNYLVVLLATFKFHFEETKTWRKQRDENGNAFVDSVSLACCDRWIWWSGDTADSAATADYHRLIWSGTINLMPTEFRFVLSRRLV